MEKKVKKLLLRKETMAVLNGTRMSDIVGGGSGPTDNPCGANANYIDYFKICVCPDGYEGDPYRECLPIANQSDNVCSHLCNTVIVCKSINNFCK